MRPHGSKRKNPRKCTRRNVHISAHHVASWIKQAKPQEDPKKREEIFEEKCSPFQPALTFVEALKGAAVSEEEGPGKSRTGDGQPSAQCIAPLRNLQPLSRSHALPLSRSQSLLLSRSQSLLLSRSQSLPLSRSQSLPLSRSQSLPLSRSQSLASAFSTSSRSARISAMSFTFNFCSACLEASVIMVRQKGHPTAMVLAPVAAAS